MRDALLPMKTDDQAASRFEPCETLRWSATEKLSEFLASYIKGLPLHEPFTVTDRESVNLLLTRSDGITGRVTLILFRAEEVAISRGTESIRVDEIERTSRDLDLAPLRVA